MLEAIVASDAEGTIREFRKEMSLGTDAWLIHLSLFPVAQRVLNPPFFNGHMPKMYGVCRDLISYLEKDEILALVQLEINEYARRPLVRWVPKPDPLPVRVSFNEIESAILDQDPEKSVVLMASFQAQDSAKELARRLLLLGSGYLKESLGHSISCTAFILREMLSRPDQDPWPCLLTLSDFFCRSTFHSTPDVNTRCEEGTDEILTSEIARAVKGQGIVNMHHTITWYALDWMHPLFDRVGYRHLLNAWIEFMGEKKDQAQTFGTEGIEPADDYSRFYRIFSRREARPVVEAFSGLAPSCQGRFLIKGLIDQYQGNYDPHYLNGLASALWVLQRHPHRASIALNGIFQYLDFFFENLKTKKPGMIY